MEHVRKTISSAMIVAATLAGCGSGPEEDIDASEDALNLNQRYLLDGATQCTNEGVTMHCCPVGYVMIGARIPDNMFKCAQISPRLGFNFIDTGTQRSGMHACPFGSVMVGLHVDSNLLMCRKLVDTPVRTEYVDTSTRDFFRSGAMHVCPLAGGFAMTGIHVGDDLLLCGQ